MFANFISDGMAMYVCIMPGSKPFVIMYIEALINFILEGKAIKWFKAKNTAAQQREFILYLGEISDKFLCGMVQASKDYENNLAIACVHVENAKNPFF